MVGTLNTGGPEVPLWLWILVPFGVACLGALLSGWLSRPWWKERRAQKTKREARLDRAADAVLGVEPDPAGGIPHRITGLIDVVPEIRATLGAMNGRTMMDLVHDIDDRQRKLETKVDRVIKDRQ